MRRLVACLSLAVFAIAGFQVDAASAWTKKFTATRGQVATACGALADGTCAGCQGTGTYSCDNHQNGCYVQCDAKSNCTGGCPGKEPARLASVGVRGVLTGGGQLAQPDTPSTRPPRPGMGASSQGPLGGGLLDGGGQGLGPRGPAATGTPLGTGGAPAAPSTPTIR